MNTHKLKIGIIQQAPDIGGAEIYLSLLIENFSKTRHEIFFASNNKKFAEMLEKFCVSRYRIPVILDVIGNLKGLIKSTFFFPFALVYYFRLLMNFKRKSVDVILMSGFSEKMLVTFVSVFFRIPIVWIEYPPLETVFRRNFYIPKVIYGLLKNIPKAIIVPAQNTKQSLVEYVRVTPAKIRVIPCGVTILNVPVGRVTLFKDDKKPFVVGNVSRLTTEKGQDVLIRAAPLVLKKNPNTRFLLVGDGPDKIFYEQIVKKLGLVDKFTITGYVDNISSYYKQMDLFVFPTVWELEGFGLVLVEAMSRKIPVIASKLGPVPEIVQDKVSGILIKPGSKEELAYAINYLIENKGTRDQLAREGQRRARKLYDINRISKEVIKVLENAAL